MILSKRKFLVKVCAIAVIFCIIFSFFLPALAYVDNESHWANLSAKKWVEREVLKGYPDGSLKLSKNITIGEFLLLLCRIFNYKYIPPELNQAIKEENWQKEFILKAVGVGLIDQELVDVYMLNGYITRQEAAYILAKAFDLPAGDKKVLEAFSDSQQIAEEYKDSIASLVQLGYMRGKPGKKIDPLGYLTRGETVKLLDNLVSDLKNKPGIYSGQVKGNVVVNTSDVQLNNMRLEGDLYLTEGIGEGEVYLKNVDVKGRILVKGGGINSITLEDVIVDGQLIVHKNNGMVKIVAKGTSEIPDVVIKSGAILEESDITGKGFLNVKIVNNLPKSTVILSGRFENVEINGDRQEVKLESNTKVVNLKATSNVRITGNGILENEPLIDKSKVVVNVKVIQKEKNELKEEESKKASEKQTDEKLSTNPIVTYIQTSSNQTSSTNQTQQGSNQQTSGNSGTSQQNNENQTTEESVYLPESPVFKNVSVHDPSVIKVNDTYYIFGSHLAAAKSKDLMQWELIDSGVRNDNKIIPNVFTELAETFEWAQTNTLWAPHVVLLKNGKFYMYYCACKGDSPLSALGIAVADNVEGPYRNLGIILKSGMKGTSEDGTPYDATKHPNVVDPHVFYDKEGKLWMVYGSYSGGIFILQLDPETGLPLPGQGYGKKLVGGNHSRIEGPFILYNPQTDYYYLFLSFGGLASDGGYNIRVARSKNPDGPYYDSEGHDMIECKGKEGSFFDDASIEPYGVKLIGNFLFDTNPQNVNGPGYGYVSPGHNSAYYDPQTGKYYLIFHTRFPGKVEQHEVRVHQLFFNEDGWPVVAPSPYVGEKAVKVKTQDIVGEYLYINHGKDISAKIKGASVINLNNDGTISGDVYGTWNLKGDYYGEIVLESNENGVKTQEIYKGVFVKCWDPTTKSYVMTFSGLSQKGVSIWLKQINKSALADVVINSISIPTTVGNEGITLPTNGYLNVPIQWQSGNPNILTDSGSLVSRPENSTRVVLTATVTYGGVTRTKQFEVLVTGSKFDPDNDLSLIAYYPFDGDLNEATGKVSPGIVTGNRINNGGGNITFSEGIKGNSAVFNGESGIRLPDDLIKDWTYTVSFWVYAEQLTQFTTTFFGAYSENSWISFTPLGWDGASSILWSGSDPWYDGICSNNVKIGEWTHVAITIDNGIVKVYMNGRLVFEGNNFPDRFSKKPGGIFALGVNWWDLPFKGKIDELRIYDRALLQDEIKVLAGDKVKEGGLIAWFKFEDNLQDSTGNFNEGFAIGNKIDVPGGQISYGEGVVGKAVYLDGNSGVRLPNGLISSYEYTVSLWVYAEKLTMFTPTFFGAMSQTKWISVVPYGHNGVGNSIMVWSGSERWIDGGTGVKINPNTWTHIAFTVKRGNLTVYVDGEKKFEGTGVPNIFNSYDAIFTLGVNWWDAPFKGMIDELKIYDISLSHDEIKKLSQTK